MGTRARDGQAQPGQAHALADRLQDRLNALGLSQSELARRSDVSLSYINRLVRAQIRNPTIDVVRKLADALDLRLDELAGPGHAPSTPPVAARASTRASIGEPVPILGRPISDPRMFFGHERLIRAMRRLWTGPTMQHALLSGPPQGGKSSLLLCLKNAAQLRDELWHESWPTLLLSRAERAQAAAEQARLWTSPSMSIDYVYASFADPQLTLSEPRELVSEILDQLAIDSDRLPEDDGGDNRALLVEFVKRVRSSIARPTVWLFDDVDRMLIGVEPQAETFGGLVSERFKDFAPLFLRACRTLAADDRVPLAFVMTYSSGLDTMIDLQRDASSPFFGLVCHKFTLGPLEPPPAHDLAELLLRAPHATDGSTDRRATECIVDASHGWPYLIQRLCQDFVASSTADDGAQVPAREWDAQRVLERDPYTHRLLAEG
jgi:transcriptional regulator with XRE-family HTH domain